MMNLTAVIRFGSFAFAVLVLSACSESDGAGAPGATTADGGGPSDSGTQDGSAGCASGSLPWRMTMHETTFDGPSIAGVRGCVLDRPEIACGTSDADGVLETCVPADSDVALTFEKDGFARTIYAIRTGTVPANRGRWTEIALFADGPTKQYWEQFGVTYPPTSEGLLWIHTVQDDPDAPQLPAPMGSVSATFSPAAAKGPFYVDETGAHDPSASQTNVLRPNIYTALMPHPAQTVTISHPTLGTCGHLDGGWGGSAASSVRVPIRAGFRTFIAVTCR